MLYRIKIDLAFDAQAPALALFNHASGFFDMAIPFNPGTPECEPSIIQRLDCHHDDQPLSPCVLIDELIKPPPDTPPQPPQ